MSLSLAPALSISLVSQKRLSLLTPVRTDIAVDGRNNILYLNGLVAQRVQEEKFRSLSRSNRINLPETNMKSNELLAQVISVNDWCAMVKE